MDVVVEIEPDAALRQAERCGVFVVPAEAEYDDHDWELLVEEWEDAYRARGRASIVVYVELYPTRATVSFDGKGLPCFAGERLDAAMRRMLEQVVNRRGYEDGSFASWMTKSLPLDSAGRVVAKARRLERFARDPVGARAFEDGGKAVTVWSVHAL